MRIPFRIPALLILGVLLLQGCEDDPILEPTEDDSGGGSYGTMTPLTRPQADARRASNPATF